MTGHAAPPVFAEPWHAQLFALTVHLGDTGRIRWPDWTQRFAATLKRHGLTRELDGGDDYFNAWLETLEAFLQDEGVAAAEVDQIAADWARAYLDTPHGMPVRLNRAAWG